MGTKCRMVCAHHRHYRHPHHPSQAGEPNVPNALAAAERNHDHGPEEYNAPRSTQGNEQQQGRLQGIPDGHDVGDGASYAKERMHASTNHPATRPYSSYVISSYV